MTEAMRRGGPAERCDVAVVGAGLPGLLSATLLARDGAKVVLLDAARRPGGRLQTLGHQGFAIDVSPPLWESEGLAEALAAAGAASPPLALVVERRDVFAAVVEGGAVRGGAHPLPVPGAVPSPAVLGAVADLLGAKPRTWAMLGEACAELLAADDGAAVDSPGPAAPAGTLAEWASSRGLEPAVTAALLRSAELLGAAGPSVASARRVARRLRSLASGAAAFVAPAQHAIAGARGLVDALVDAAVAAGVETRLGTRVLSLEVERGRLRGLVLQREELPFLATLEADRVVIAVPPAEASRLLPPEFRPTLAPAAGSLLGFAFGLRSAPWPQDAPPPPALRLVRPPGAPGSPAAPGAPGAPILVAAPQAHAPGVAPPGQGLLLAYAPVADAHLDAGELRRLAMLVRSAVLDLHPGAEVGWERSWFRAGEAIDPFADPTWPEALTDLAGVRFAGWSVRLARCVTSGPSAAAASAVAAASSLRSTSQPSPEGGVSLGRPRRSG